ncbi:translation initiation factor IF-2-like [Pseudoliparis swirei]|uniref:translation initiation factor IF-2-like n=1 Tax=Pseudoliparis swirei TaxID=2059687 RepID=UPI0024BDCFC4|nr:translation initiation factor IF-2-like [Pseudoliparis swirei]
MKHIIYMILNDRSAELNLRFSVRVDDFNYNVYASSSEMKCFHCGEEGHTARVCSKRGDPAPAGPGGSGPSGAPRRATPAWGAAAGIATAASLRGDAAGAPAGAAAAEPPIPAESAASGVTAAVSDTHVGPRLQAEGSYGAGPPSGPDLLCARQVHGGQRPPHSGRFGGLQLVGDGHWSDFSRSGKGF